MLWDLERFYCYIILLLDLKMKMMKPYISKIKAPNSLYIRYISNIWHFINSNLISISIGGVLSHLLTRSYRDQELKDLTEDVKNLQNDLRNREDDIKKINISNDTLRSSYLFLTNELNSCNLKNLKCDENLKEYKFSYDNTPWHCWGQPKPKISLNEYQSKNSSNTIPPSPNPK